MRTNKIYSFLPLKISIILIKAKVYYSMTGKRIKNPVVLCLNMLNCTVDEAEQAKIRFQFGVFNTDVKHWEYCHVSRTVLELQSCSEIDHFLRIQGLVHRRQAFKEDWRSCTDGQDTDNSIRKREA